VTSRFPTLADHAVHPGQRSDKRLGLQADYEVQKARIIGRRTQTSFTFHGLRGQSVHNIKLLEGADILWVEEAQNVCKKSWPTVIPTMVAAPPGRRGGSNGGHVGWPSVTRSNWLGLNRELNSSH
jgi:hypothetical protein